MVCHWMLLAAETGILPDDLGAQIIFVIVGVVILGLYFLTRRTQKRSADAYWERRKRERELRENDPDMRDDEP